MARTVTMVLLVTANSCSSQHDFNVLDVLEHHHYQYNNPVYKIIANLDERHASVGQKVT